MTDNFSIDDNLFPVDLNKYLLRFLSKTSPGTNYWDNPPKGAITDRQIGRVVLQIHQLLDILSATGFILKDSTFLDVGTGNGMIPRLMLALTNIKKSWGSDPFLDGEHKTSWRKSDQHSDFIKIIEFIEKISGTQKMLTTSSYIKESKYEVRTYIPRDLNININLNKLDIYKFFQVDAESLSLIGSKFDILYCKAIEHIHKWDSVFKESNECLNPNGIFVIKHRPFFSYLGAHRYGSIELPWGHVILNDDQYKKFVNIYHKDRANEMIDFMKKDLSYPRKTVNDMIEIGIKNGFEPVSIRYEAANRQKELVEILKENPNILERMKNRYRNLGLDEILSGMVHLVFKKNV